MAYTDDPYQWFYDATEKGAYRKDLTLKGWADEIEWRLIYKAMINKDRRYNMDNEWLSFLKNLNSPSSRITPASRFASKPELPVRILKQRRSHGENQYSIDEDLNHEEGVLLPMFINTSYDDKTLLTAFKKLIRDAKEATSPKIKNNSKSISCAERGKKELTRHDALNWSNHHVLECIDYILWVGIKGDSASSRAGGDKGFANILGVNPNILRQTSLVKARYILSKVMLGRIRASLSGF